MRDIYIYNTLGRKKERFSPIKNGEVSVYTCGPTVYHYAHLGNLRAYIFADILNNTLRQAGYEIKHQINLTDVGHLVSDADDGQDKIEKGAEREGRSVWEIAKFYTEAFWNDLRELKIDIDKFIWTRATDYIEEQIEMISILEEKGYLYKTSDGLYFDTSKFPNYKEFADLNIEGLQKGKRVEDEKNEKKNKTDFAVWKFSKVNENRQMEWPSPWGVGFPGWHLECSAMSRAVLGNHLDIHTGGVDHIPVHHTNEIAQSECSLEDGKRFVNYWMHVNFLITDKDKMSKSSGDFLRLESLKERSISPLAFKYLLLMTHYRKELKFSFDSLDAANSAFQKLIKKVSSLKAEVADLFLNSYTLSEPAKKYQEAFSQAMSDDLNTSVALAKSWSMLNDKDIPSIDKYTLILYFDKYFGLDLEAVK